MPYTDSHGRPELIMDPLIKRGSATLSLDQLPDGTPVDVGDLTSDTDDPAAARAHVAARRQHLIDVAAGDKHIDDAIPGVRPARGSRRHAGR